MLLLTNRPLFFALIVVSLILNISTSKPMPPPFLMSGVINLTTAGTPYTQNFDTLSNVAGSTANVLTIPGWYLNETGGSTRDNEQYAVDTGSSTTGDAYSYGTGGSTDRALGGLQTGTLIPVFGASFSNNTGSVIASLAINYTGEEWRLGTSGRTDKINFEYSTNATDLTTGTWTPVAALNFVTPDSTTTGAKNGNAAADRTMLSATISGLNIPNGAGFWIRWTNVDASGADDGLAVDDFSLTPIAAVAATISVNVPTGISFSLNSETYTGSQVINLPFGIYTLSSTSSQMLGTGAQAIFVSWSDAGAISHSITLDSNPINISGTFKTQYQLTTTAGAGGTVSPANGIFYDAGMIVPVVATPNSGFIFGGWTGNVASASSASTTVTMDTPKSIMANFLPLIPVNVNVPMDVSFTLNSITYTGTQTINLVPGTYKISTTTNQPLDEGVRAAFQNWSDGGSISHSITVGSDPVTIAGTFTTQYLLTTLAGTGGTVTPASASYHNAGVAVRVRAIPNPDYAFINWTGSVASATSASTTVTMDSPKSVTANFGLIPSLNSEFSDPFVCNGIGSAILVTAQLTNPNMTAQEATFNVTLPSRLTVVPGTCTASIGACAPAPSNQISWTGNIPAGQTVTFNYQAQIADGTRDGTTLTINSTASVAGVNASISASGIVSCPTLTHEPENVKMSDQKAGSVLVFPYYIAKSSAGSDTKIQLTNTGSESVFIHLFFIDDSSCQQADFSACLSANASLNLQASEMDPENVGWLIAVAVDEQGNPAQNNVLIGNAFVKDGNYVGNYGAESFWAHSDNPATINGDKATLRFNGTSYDAMPNQFAVEIQSPRDIVGQKIVTVGMSGDITTNSLTGATDIGTGVVYNGNEKPFASFVDFLSGRCQATNIITTIAPRVPFTLGGIIPSGQIGTMKLNIGGGVGILMTPQTSKKWSGIRGLHKTGTTYTSLTIPVFSPKCS